MLKKLVMVTCEAGFMGFLWIALERMVSTRAAVVGMFACAGGILWLHRQDVRALIKRLDSPEFNRTEENSKRDWNREWKELAKQFEEIGNDRIRAEWYSESLAFDGSSVGDQWVIREESGSEKCKSLCRQAGVMLLRSPKVFASLSVYLRTRSDDTCRWLYFIKEKEAMKIEKDGSVTAGRRKMDVQYGSVEDLASVSARACLNCSTDEL